MPKNAETWFRKGLNLWRLNRQQEAIFSYEKCLRFQPDNVLALRNLGGALLYHGQYQEAISRLNAALDLDRGDSLTWCLKGEALLALERHAEAIICFHRSLEIEPKDPIAWHHQADCLRALGEYESALAGFNKALELINNNDYSYYFRAQIFEQLDLYQAALQDCDRTIALFPQDRLVWQLRGKILARLAKYEEADFCFALMQQDRDIGTIDRDREYALFLENRYKYNKLDRDFGKMLKIAIDEHPLDAQLWFELGLHLQNIERYTEALACYDKATTIDPENYRSWYQRSTILCSQERHEEQIVALKKALAIKPNAMDAWLNLIHTLYFYLERYEETLIECNKALAIAPEDRGIISMQNLARLQLRIAPNLPDFNRAFLEKPKGYDSWVDKSCYLLEIGQYQRALLSLNKAVKVCSQDHIAWYRRGLLLCNFFQKYQQAIESFELVLDLQPRYYPAYYYLGVAWEFLGEYTKALSCYDRALEIFPHYDLAWQGRASALYNLGKNYEADRSYNRALFINPEV
jgi:tetratricopeptide (TPR) repeat protein